MDIEHSDRTFKHVLLPSWLGAYLFRGKSYHLCVNARTGAVQGERPYSWVKIALGHRSPPRSSWPSRSPSSPPRNSRSRHEPMAEPTPAPGLRRDLYDLLTGDDEARVCKDIPDDACREQPRNFFIHGTALTLTKLGDGLADAKLVLAWLLSSLGRARLSDRPPGAGSRIALAAAAIAGGGADSPPCDPQVVLGRRHDDRRR